MCLICWLDNGVVTLASTLSGVEPQNKVKCWSDSAKEHIDVDRPDAVQLYNNFMGGVDKLDFLISLHRILAKTRKWPVRMIFHFLDFSLANSWLQYRDFEVDQGTPKSNIVDLLACHDEVVLSLIMSRLPGRSLGRPRSCTDGTVTSPEPPKRSKIAVRPVENVRYDLAEHWPESVDGKPQRCKLEQCHGRSRVRCKKCNVHLCLMKDRNCFEVFHTK